MNIKITSDSTCDLPKELVQRYNIEILPLIVMKGSEECVDGVTITPTDIFSYVSASGKLCSTAARSVGYFQDVFGKYAQEYDGVVHIDIGSGFSASYQNASLAAEEFDNVRVVDSRNLTVGQGFVVLKACELAKTVSSLDELTAQLQDVISRVETSFVVDKLDYLAKGGRCSSATAMGANLLNLKPCVELPDNKLVVGKKYRGSLSKCLTGYIRDRLNGRTDIDNSVVFVVHSTISDEAFQAAMDAVKTYGHFEQIIEADAGSTISCHCGPGTLGIIYLRK